MKICKICKTEKDLSKFVKQKANKDGLTNKCKECNRIKGKKYREINKDKLKEYSDFYRIEHNEKMKNYMKNYNIINAEQINIKKKQYYENNKVKIRNNINDYFRNRYINDPMFRLSRNIRSLIKQTFRIKKITKLQKSEIILGCTFEEFKIHLEKQFDEHMNWSNQGTYWHMDHIKPISLAKNEQEVYELNHYTNFQPLFWKDNLSKSNKY